MLSDSDLRICFGWDFTIIFGLGLNGIIDCHIAEPDTEQRAAAIRIECRSI